MIIGNNIEKWIKMTRKSNHKTSVVPSFDEADEPIQPMQQ